MDNEYIVTPVQGNRKGPFSILLAGITYENPNYEVHRQKGEMFTAEYVISGRGYINIDGKEYIACGGDTYILPSNLKLHYYSDSKEAWKKIWFNATGDFSNKMTKMFGIDDSVVFKNINTLEYLEKILKLCENKGLSAEELNRNCAAVYTEMIMFMSEKVNNKKSVSEEAEVLKKYLDLHLEEKVNIKKLASLIYRSESQTIRIFKKNYNKTPYDYLLDERIERAKSLIRNTSLSIKEIAYRVGFSDEHYFSAVFREKTNTSPTRYRRFQ